MHKTIRKTLLAIFWSIAALPLWAQTDTPFSKDAFPTQKAALKEAISAIKYGDEAIKVDEDYEEALKAYFNAHKFNPHNAELNYKIAYCYLHSAYRQQHKALPYAENVLKLAPQYKQDAYLLLGEAQQYNGLFQEAIASFRQHQLLSGQSMQRKIRECENAIQLAKRQGRVQIDHLGAQMNSEYPEYAVVISADERTMYFTSRRPDTKGGQRNTMDGLFMEDIYRSEHNGQQWLPAEPVQNINSENNDATVGLSPDGSKMLIYIEGDLYECQLRGKEWSRPVRLPDTINSRKYSETSASFSPDQQLLYFVSNNPEGSHGGRDIFVSQADGKGGWGPARNLGPIINTKEDEEGVFIHPDGKTLYFSSKGHNNIGGYDIFRSRLQEDGNWSTPENLGMPINTPADDVFFAVNARGNRGYYSTVREDSFGDKDLYVATFLGPEKPVIMTSEDPLIASTNRVMSDVALKQRQTDETNLVVFKGEVLDEKTRKPVEAEIAITNLHGNTQTTANTNSSTGRFLVPLATGSDYAIAINAPGYLFHSENFSIGANYGYMEVEKSILLKRVEVGSTIVLNNIFFDLNKSTLKKESISELDVLVKLMKQNPSIRVEIGGHTDHIGSDNYNMLLSESRAKAVVSYLTEHGIEDNRLTSKGYGESSPVATNDTAEGRAKNRRTEFRIVGKLQ